MLEFLLVVCTVELSKYSLKFPKGEAYRGHIFWDELFVLNTYNLRMPEASRNLLLYRYNRLDAARDIALSVFIYYVQIKSPVWR